MAQIQGPVRSLTTASGGVDAEAFSRDSGAALTAYLEERAAKSRVPYRFHSFDAQEFQIVKRFTNISRAFELSIVEATKTSRHLIESLLFGGGRPVVLFPPGGFCGRLDNIAIAWDGSVAAARALSCAGPLMRSATSVRVISVIDDKEVEDESHDLLLAALDHAGFSVEDIRVKRDGETTAAAIQSAAQQKHADLLIAGAYSHSKLREVVLGGVTRELLGGVELPVLLAH
ncbi:universal stress protein [Rhizobium sp. RAF56]|uniref:universal stress protein n=1 Tax=Rhizobium sp. RAF56 TaxID=3233062 RepID=UPI003F992BB4